MAFLGGKRFLPEWNAAHDGDACYNLTCNGGGEVEKSDDQRTLDDHARLGNEDAERDEDEGKLCILHI